MNLKLKSALMSTANSSFMCHQKHNNVPIDYLYVCQSCGEQEHAEAMGNYNSICS